MTSPDNWSFTTSGPTACPCTIWESDATPANPSVNDSNSVELGVKFQVTTSGWIYGVRFYKGPGNTGTHTGSLWTDTGTSARPRHFHQRDRERLADAGVPHGRAGQRRTDLCR